MSIGSARRTLSREELRVPPRFNRLTPPSVLLESLSPSTSNGTPVADQPGYPVTLATSRSRFAPGHIPPEPLPTGEDPFRVCPVPPPPPPFRPCARP